jgi:hypothetical protein
MLAIEWPATPDPWLAAGTERVLLPSGTRVLWEATTVQQLMVRDALPGYLRSMAMQFAGAGIVYDQLNEDDQKRWRETVALFVSEGIRAIALPGADEFARAKFTPAQCSDDDPVMPRPDLETMQQLAMHLRTVEQVNATGRLIELERQLRDVIANADDATVEAFRVQHDRESDEIQRSIAREMAGGLAGWEMFRRQSGGDHPGQDSAAVPVAPVGPADHLGPGGRPRAGRRGRDPRHPSGRRARPAKPG